MQTLATQINNFWLQSVRYQIDSERPVSLHHPLSPLYVAVSYERGAPVLQRGGLLFLMSESWRQEKMGISCYQTEQEREVCERD